MNEKIKAKSLKSFLLFLATMFVMTFVSRGIYANSIPRVSAVSVTNQALSQTVECSGTLETNRNQPVLLPPELLISEVYVKPGDKVKAGDLLLRFDTGYLSEKITDLEAEIQAEQESNSDFYQSKNEIPIFT
ncbi:MAG: biotin/lipoyl-binding protein [Oscillospiraceae bacterium]|nr:biotin/lipoyl-binding protein [Oscillospiraceae bacterium]